MNYLTKLFGDEKRGNVRYCFPNRCVRVGINVLGKYDNGSNIWLNFQNDQGEWAAVYTWVSEVKLCENKGKAVN